MFVLQFRDNLAQWVADSPVIWPLCLYKPSLAVGVLYSATVGAIVYYLCAQYIIRGRGNPKPSREDYQRVYNEIASRLGEDDDYDDGSYGPILVRLAWHASGTFDIYSGTGGSNGATMRFCPENSHSANAGLNIARNFLSPIKSKCWPFHM
jgi:cytochrome c peroxidase